MYKEVSDWVPEFAELTVQVWKRHADRWLSYRLISSMTDTREGTGRDHAG